MKILKGSWAFLKQLNTMRLFMSLLNEKLAMILIKTNAYYSNSWVKETEAESIRENEYSTNVKQFRAFKYFDKYDNWRSFKKILGKHK